MKKKSHIPMLISTALLAGILSGCTTPLTKPAGVNPYADMPLPEARKMLQDYLNRWERDPKRDYTVLDDGISAQYTDGSGRSADIVGWARIGEVGYVIKDETWINTRTGDGVTRKTVYVRLYRPRSVIYLMAIPFRPDPPRLTSAGTRASAPSLHNVSTPPSPADQNQLDKTKKENTEKKSLAAVKKPVKTIDALIETAITPIVFLIERVRAPYPPFILDR